jgi:hypothetical protein
VIGSSSRGWGIPHLNFLSVTLWAEWKPYITGLPGRQRERGIYRLNAAATIRTVRDVRQVGENLEENSGGLEPVILHSILLLLGTLNRILGLIASQYCALGMTNGYTGGIMPF